VVINTDKWLNYDKIIEVMGLYYVAGITDIAVAVEGPGALRSFNTSFPNFRIVEGIGVQLSRDAREAILVASNA
jgi:hypothetical protein